MTNNLKENKRIAKNTALLYIRMMIVMIINIYMVRLLLEALGVEDYGIFNVVAGIVTIAQCLTGVLTTSTQRFYSLYLGEKDFEKVKNTFAVSFNIHVLFSIIVLLISETIGLWLLNTQLVFPLARMATVNWIYQFSIFSFVALLLEIPYSAAVITHEDMNVFAFISIVDCILKLLLAISLNYVLIDRLFLYGFLLLVIATIQFVIYVILGRRKYTECHLSVVTDKKLYKKLLLFSGWTLFGSTASVGMNQGCTILTNIFFGPVVNTSRAIAFQINSAINAFSGNFIMAVRPPMIKAYAEKSFSYLNKMFVMSNKFIYYSMLVIFLPLFFEMDYILKIWLNTSDPQTIQFSRLIIIYTIIIAMNNPITVIIQATGKVKQYHVPVETFTLLCLPVTYFLFRAGFQAGSTFGVMIAAALLSHVIRITCIKKYYVGFNLKDYLSFLLRAILLTIIIVFMMYMLHGAFENDLIRLFFVTFASILLVGLSCFFIALNKNEKVIVLDFIKKKTR